MAIGINSGGACQTSSLNPNEELDPISVNGLGKHLWARLHRHRCWLSGFGLVMLIMLAYQRVLHAGFIWDDDQHVWTNPCIVGPKSFADIWISSEARICPLVLSTFWLEHKLWGMNPLPYHLVNVFVHAACALLLWRLLCTMRVRGAWLGAVFWALHPVQVETVAWVTELKNTQSCLFFLLSILCFLKWLEMGSSGSKHKCIWHYALAVFVAALAMASKSSTVVLPVVLGLCWWWQENRWRWQNLLWLLPLLMCSVLSSLLSIWTQRLEGGITDEWHRSLPERVIAAGRIAWFYLGKLVCPHPLIFIYPRWSLNANQVLSYLPALLVLLLLAVLWTSKRAWCRPLFMAYTCFLALLLPVLGLVDHFFLRYSFVGDHFQYLASMAPLSLLGAAIVEISRASVRLKPWALSMAASILFASALMTWRHSRVFENSYLLWTDTVAKNSFCWMAENNLGCEYLKMGEPGTARQHFERSLSIFPGNAEAENNLGSAVLKLNLLDDAIAHFRRAVQINPDSFSANNNLGTALSQAGRLDEAERHLREAVRLDASVVDAHISLGSVLFKQGKTNNAMAEWKLSLTLHPESAEAHVDLGTVLLEQGKLDEAVAHFERAIELRPLYSMAHNALGAALRRAGQLDKAADHYRSAIEVDPNFAGAQFNLAQVLRQSGRLSEALPHYEKAIDLMPANTGAMCILAWILATSPDTTVRDAERALQLADQANKMAEGHDPSVLRVVAAAYAAKGRFAEAREQVINARMIATGKADTGLVEALKQDEDHYQHSTALTDLTLLPVAP